MSVLLQKLYEAYYSARRQKRNKPEVLRFELNYEEHLYNLYNDIINHTYQPLPARVFVVKKPVHREIFAPAFRDRIVHHLIYHYIYEHIDKKFIYDSYSCRVGKGTLFGIKRAKTFLRKATSNYTKDAYVLKLDITGYFMNINRALLLNKINQMVEYDQLRITQTEKNALKYLIETIVMKDVSTDAERKSPHHFWKTIPTSKSLFATGEGCGLPIGALTSQLFSNIYLNEIDHLMKKDFRYYGRYVDDLLFVDTDQEKLKKVISQIREAFHNIGLRLHPKKIYLQHYTKGFYFLGHYIKPYRSYISRRTKKYIHAFLKSVQRQWEEATKDGKAPTLFRLQEWETRFNAYFGILSKTNAYRYVQGLLKEIPEGLMNFVELTYCEQKAKMKMTIKAPFRLKNHYASLYPVIAGL